MSAPLSAVSSLHRWAADRFELSRNAGQGNVRPMEGMRGLAVLLVFLPHYVQLIEPRMNTQTAFWPFASDLQTLGQAGVDFFFLLSGYLIYGTLISRAQAFGKFMWRRVERIYPTFLAVLMLYLGLSFVGLGESKLPPGPWDAGLYILQNVLLLPGLFPIKPMISVAWSLSYEMFYYLLLPLLVGGLSMRQWPVLWRLTLFGALGVTLVLYCLQSRGPYRLGMFVAGIWLWELLKVDPRGPGPWVAAAGLVIGLGATVMAGNGVVPAVTRESILCAGLLLVCWSCFASPGNWLARAFAWTPLRWVGNMSYSYYLFHGLALKLFFMLQARLQPQMPPDWVSFAIWILPAIIFTILASVPLFLWVELPLSLHRGAAKAAKRAQGLSAMQAPPN